MAGRRAVARGLFAFDRKNQAERPFAARTAFCEKESYGSFSTALVLKITKENAPMDCRLCRRRSMGAFV